MIPARPPPWLTKKFENDSPDRFPFQTALVGSCAEYHANVLHLFLKGWDADPSPLSV
jgi:hypothetical protein